MILLSRIVVRTTTQKKLNNMKTFNIGRGPSNDVVINDPVVSTNHAVITVSDFGEITIKDLNSKNGTFVDGRKVTQATLTSNSVVVLGNHSIDWKQIVQSANVKKPVGPVAIPADVVDQKLIGRNSMAHIRFASDSVSDKHAFLCRKKSGEVLIIDNNSTNGTYVNGSKISAPHVLKKGDVVSLANRYTLTWENVFKPKRNTIKIVSSIAASVVVLIGIAVGIWIWPWGSGGTWQEVFEEHKHDVAMIYAEYTYIVKVNGEPAFNVVVGEDGSLYEGYTSCTGTGFFISNDGKLLTNRHVVNDGDRADKNKEIIKNNIHTDLFTGYLQTGYREYATAVIDVELYISYIGVVLNDTHVGNNIKNVAIECNVVKVSKDKDLDVAMIQTSDKNLPQRATYVKLSDALPSKKLVPGYEVGTIGFPLAEVLSLTDYGLEANNQTGSVTQERSEYVYGHNITIHQGASGSPVYNIEGEFAGIIVSGFLGLSQGYNHAIHPDQVIKFVNE
jgi:pSer/pThr/pTyr-binding forkhead associated (FHA) protein/V8-like Glu-specific endopeptidase